MDNGPPKGPAAITPEDLVAQKKSLGLSVQGPVAIPDGGLLSQLAANPFFTAVSPPSDCAGTVLNLVVTGFWSRRPRCGGSFRSERSPPWRDAPSQETAG